MNDLRLAVLSVVLPRDSVKYGIVFLILYLNVEVTSFSDFKYAFILRKSHGLHAKRGIYRSLKIKR